jgi:RNA polymerase sigma-70 factor (ECF subfamily)
LNLRPTIGVIGREGPTLTSDAELIRRIVGKDAGAFDTLLHRHEGRIQAHLRRLIRDEEAVDDLTQETFLRLWERASQWREQGAVGGWLTRIATNLALNHIRSLRRRRQRPLHPVPDLDEDEETLIPGWMVDASALGPHEIVEAAEERHILRSLMDRLPEGKREILRMVHQQEMSLTEAARALGIPVGTAKSRLHYALRQLGREWTDIQSE